MAQPFDLAPHEIPTDAVRARLAELEREYDVRVVYAVESGSRAWGFASRDSDVDARFLYLRQPEWYLSVFPGRDVIEPPIDGLFDVSGWDVRKALGLLYKSNPPLLEWLHSPLVYREDNAVVDLIRSVVPQFYSRRSSFYHYWSMARSTYREELRGETVKPKKYFYALRPLLCCRWIEAEPEAPPPMEFERLADRFLPSGGTRDALDTLLREKREGSEGDRRPPVPALQAYVEHELAALEPIAQAMPRPQRDRDTLNRVFRQCLDLAWAHEARP